MALTQSRKDALLIKTALTKVVAKRNLAAQNHKMTRVMGLPLIASLLLGARLVVLQDHYLDKALAENERLKGLYPTDRQFVRMLVTSLLRHHKQLDGLLSDYVTRKPPAEAFLILMMGAVQLLLLRTPTHAALSTTVDLMRAAGFDHMTGMANAICANYLKLISTS